MDAFLNKMLALPHKVQCLLSGVAVLALLVVVALLGIGTSAFQWSFQFMAPAVSVAAHLVVLLIGAGVVFLLSLMLVHNWRLLLLTTLICGLASGVFWLAQVHINIILSLDAIALAGVILFMVFDEGINFEGYMNAARGRVGAPQAPYHAGMSYVESFTSSREQNQALATMKDVAWLGLVLTNVALVVAVLQLAVTLPNDSGAMVLLALFGMLILWAVVATLINMFMPTLYKDIMVGTVEVHVHWALFMLSLVTVIGTLLALHWFGLNWQAGVLGFAVSCTSYALLGYTYECKTNLWEMLQERRQA